MNRMTKGLLLASVIAAGALAPAAAAPRERTEMIPYERGSGIYFADVVTANFTLGDLPQAQPMRGEKAVSVAITDDSGRPVAALVHQGDAELGMICGQTDSPLQLVSRKPVHVHIYAGPGCSDVSTPTQGAVEFTFTR